MKTYTLTFALKYTARFYKCLWSLDVSLTFSRSESESCREFSIYELDISFFSYFFGPSTMSIASLNWDSMFAMGFYLSRRISFFIYPIRSSTRFEYLLFLVSFKCVRNPSYTKSDFSMISIYFNGRILPIMYMLFNVRIFFFNSSFFDEK